MSGTEETYEYCVNATMTVAAYLYVTATDPEDALRQAMEASPRDFDTDASTAEVEFNVDPTVEQA